MAIDTSNEYEWIKDLTAFLARPSMGIDGPYSITGNSGQGVTLRYSLSASNANFLGDPGAPTTASDFGGTQAEVEAILELISNVADITFVRDEANPDFTIMSSAGSGGEAILDVVNQQVQAADIYLSDSSNNYALGTPGAQTLLHEVLHVLGLSHPEEDESNFLNSGWDQDFDTLLTAMSYNNNDENHSDASTPMIFDIATLQFLYGANTSNNEGSTSYTLSSTGLGSISISDSIDGASSMTGLTTSVWDSGGNDTFILENSITEAALIDLRAGVMSQEMIDQYDFGRDENDLYYEVGDTIITQLSYLDDLVDGLIVVNAFQEDGETGDSNIENATAASGDDLIYGNNLDNVLRGMGGDDVIIGGEGSDDLYGGFGDDLLYAGIIGGFAKSDGGIIDGGHGFEAIEYDILAEEENIIDLVVQTANKAEGQYTVTKTYTDGTTSYVEVDQLYGIERIGLAEHRANTTTYSNQTYSSVTGMLNNGFVTVWKSQSQSGQSHAIVGQRFDANGEAVGNEFVISSKTDTSSYNFEPQVVDTNDGGFAVVWRGRTTSSTPDAYRSNRKKVFVSKFDSNNDVDNNIDSLMVFADPSDDPLDRLNRTQEWQPSVTLLGNGNLAIAAEAYGDGMLGADIITQVIDINSGARIGVDEDSPVNSSTSGNQLSAEVEALSSGGYVITWTDTNAADGSGSGVYGRVYHGNGGSAGSTFLVNQSTSSHQVAQNVTAVPDGTFIVTWASYHSGNYDIYIRHFSASGVALGDEILVNEETQSDQIDPDIVMLDSSRFVVVFQNNDSNGDGSSYSIWGQQYDINATTGAIEKDGTNFLVNVTANGVQREPSVSALDNGDFAVSWTSDLPGLSGDEVAYRVFVTSDSENFDSSTGQWVT